MRPRLHAGADRRQFRIVARPAGTPVHTLKVVAGGLALLVLFLAGGRWLGGSGTPALVVAARYFIPVWLCLAALNLWIGVSRAGYSVADELPIFVAIFAVPAGLAALVWWRLSR